MKLKVSELKKELKGYEQKELIQLIAELYKKNKDVQSYLSLRFLGDAVVEDLFNKAKKKIENEFFPERGFGKLRLNEAKKAISDFKKMTEDELKTMDLMLYYVKQGVEYTCSYGDINESFYNSMVSMYEKVITFCEKNEEHYPMFADRLEQVVINTEGIGWGFHDGLDYLYSTIQYLNEDEE